VTKFLQCELFTFLKLAALLILLNIIANVIGIDSYAKTIFLGSFIAIAIFILFFIWKFFLVLMSDDSTRYQCEQQSSFSKALTWLSNIV
jgi:uncharacterized membrane protein